jgi:hypothetical protein
MALRDQIDQLKTLKQSLAEINKLYDDISAKGAVGGFGRGLGEDFLKSLTDIGTRLQELPKIIDAAETSYRSFFSNIKGEAVDVETILKRINEGTLKLGAPTVFGQNINQKVLTSTGQSTGTSFSIPQTELDKVQELIREVDQLKTALNAITQATSTDKFRVLSQEDADSVKLALNNFKQLDTILEGSSSSVKKITTALQAMLSTTALTRVEFDALVSSIVAAPREMETFAKGTTATSTIVSMATLYDQAANAAILGAGGGSWPGGVSLQQATQGILPQLQNAGPSSGVVDVDQLWSNVREGVRDLSALPADQISNQFAKIETAIADFILQTHGLNATVSSMKQTLIDGADTLEVYYTVASKLGSKTVLQKEKAAFDLETGQAQYIGTPDFTFQTTTTQQNVEDITAQNFGRTQVIYDRAQQEVAALQAKMQEAGKNLAPGFTIRVDEAKISVDELSNTVQAAIPWVQQMGTAGERSGIQIKTFKIDPVTGASSAQASTVENSKALFKTSQAQTTYSNNLAKALQKVGLATEHVTSTSLDANLGLIRVNAQQQVGIGVSRQLSVAFDQQGNVVQDLNNRYAGFFSALQKNLTRVARWAIATTVIYGAINQLQQIPAALAEIDQATARLAAISGISMQEVGAYFDSTIEAAQRFGIKLTEALPAAEFALQAVGGTDQNTAMQLLADGMLLAKITGDDLKSSVDILSAALAQFNLGLDQGQVLMGKWLAMNRAYSVSLTDLARGYSTAGTLAQEFLGDGSDALDSFNALIAITARETSLSSTQLGNFLKTVLTSYSSDEVQDILSSYGIAAKDSTGELRNFRDVLYETYLVTTKYDARTATALADISKGLGGGGSRQTAYVAAMISGLNRLTEAEAVSRTAEESTSENYLQFVNTLTDNLKDKFQELNLEVSKFLKVFGESTILPFLTSVTVALTNVVKLFENLNGDLLGLVPKLGVAVLMAKQLENVKFLSTLGSIPLAVASGGIGNVADLGTGLRVAVSNTLNNMKTNLNSQTIGISIAASIAAGLVSGFAAEQGGLEIGLSTTLTTVVGALTGGALFGPVGALMGAQLAASFSDSFSKHINLRYSTQDLVESFGGKELAVDSTEFTAAMVDKFRGDLNGLAEASITAAGVSYTIEPIFIRRLMEAESEEDFDTPARKLAYRYYSSIRDALALEEAELEKESVIDTRLAQALEVTVSRQQTIKQPFVGIGDTVNAEVVARREAIRRKLLSQVLSEDISNSDFNNTLDRMVPATDIAIQAWDALSAAYKQSGQDFYDVMETFTLAPEEWSSGLIELITQINSLQSQIQLAKDAGEDFSKMQTEQNAIVEEATLRYNAMQDAVIAAAGGYELPSFTDRRTDTKATVEEDINIGTLEQARAARFNYASNESFYQELGLNSFEAYYEGYVQRLPDLYIATKDGLMQIKGLSSEFFGVGASLGTELREGMEDSFNVRRLEELDPSRMGEVEAANRYWVNYLANIKGMTSQQYIQEEGIDMNLILGDKNVFQKILTTNEAMNFVLQDILDTEKKQLEGMWNIPEGGTFWVPLTSLFYQQGQNSYPALPEVQDTRTGAGATAVEDYLAENALPTTSTSRQLVEQDAGQLHSLLMQELIAMQAKPKATSTGGLSGMGGVHVAEDRASILPIASEERSSFMEFLETVGAKFSNLLDSLYPPTTTSATSRSKGAYYDKADLGGGKINTQSLNINVNVPEPSQIKVESMVTANLYLDGRVISTIVKRELSRELSRIVYNKRYTVPARV